MRILVTGGAGYIGSHAVRLFLSRGHDVWIYDNLSEGHRAAVPAERLIVGDLAETLQAGPCSSHAPHRGGGSLRQPFTYVQASRFASRESTYQNNLVNLR